MMYFISRIWKGQEKLSIVFWGYFVFIIFVLNLVLTEILHQYLLSGWMLSEQWRAVSGFILALFGGLLLAYTLWILISVWRCAVNTEQQHWTYLARIIVLISAIPLILGPIEMLYVFLVDSESVNKHMELMQDMDEINRTMDRIHQLKK